MANNSICTVPKVLKELEFGSLLVESNIPVTETGNTLLNKYKEIAINNAISCNIVNSFIKEASLVRYDNSINELYENLIDYITLNKISWALASACESINANTSRYNYINRSAAAQVSNLLEMDEYNVISYIKAGALKGVMFCEDFRNIAKAVFKDRMLINKDAEYTSQRPVSITEDIIGDGIYFAIENRLYKIDSETQLLSEEKDWNHVSNTFKTINSILPKCTITEGTIELKINGLGIYIVKEEGMCSRTGEKTQLTEVFTAKELRENNALIIKSMPVQLSPWASYLLEGIALITENYNNIIDLDNASIYTTAHDKFLVIESGEKDLYAILLKSDHTPNWSINENAINALTFIKSKTNVVLNNIYENRIVEAVKDISESKVQEINESLHDDTIGSLRKRIDVLTEKYKDNAIMLAVLSDLASRVNEAE